MIPARHKPAKASLSRKPKKTPNKLGFRFAFRCRGDDRCEGLFVDKSMIAGYMAKSGQAQYHGSIHRHHAEKAGSLFVFEQTWRKSMGIHNFA